MVQNMEYYYEGLRGLPKLLARSNREPWIRPVDGLKSMYNIRSDHPLQQALESGLAEAFISTIRTMEPGQAICINYVRLGYDEKNVQKNPATVWIMVERGTVPEQQAQWVVDEFYKHCRAFQMSSINVEMVEGERCEGVGPNTQASMTATQQLVIPQSVPHIGSSIAVATDPDGIHNPPGNRIATLGGYVRIDGKVGAITNHHAIFGTSDKDPRAPYPGKPYVTMEEIKGKITVLQPAEQDLAAAIGNEQQLIDCLSEEKQRSVGKEGLLAAARERMQDLKSWTPTKLPIGTVSRTTGIYVPPGNFKGFRCRRDIAVIELGNESRCVDNTKFLNQLPPITYMANTNNRAYTKEAMTVGDEKTPEGVLKTRADLPKYLKRGLTLDEIKNKTKAMEGAERFKYGRDSHYVLWKVGRTTHVTAGIINGINSHYLWTDGKTVSEELMVKSLDREIGFFKPGDSGALVFDTEGYVVGQLWGGPFASNITFVTPMDTVLETIRQTFNAKKVELVVRPEEFTDTSFDPPI